ncbi:MAG: AmpG family muropeptide MFS transporter [Pseudomonadota bacterium]
MPELNIHFLAQFSRVYFERRLLFVLAMGFASGLPLYLTLSTMSIWLTESGVSLATIGLFALVGTPYSVKFLWAPLVDSIPVPILSRVFGRRRAWMMVIQVALAICIIGLGFSRPEVTPLLTAIWAIGVTFFSASQDIVIDAYRIEILDEDQQGAGAAMTQAGYRIGGIVSGAGALYLAEVIAWPIVFCAMAGILLLGFIAALLAPNSDSDSVLIEQTAATGKPLQWFKDFVRDPFREFFQRTSFATAILILAFILLYKFGDAFAGVMANPFYIKIGFSKSEIASVSKVFGVIATMVGVFAGGYLVAKIGVMKSLLYAGLLQMFSNLMFAAQAAIGADVQFLVATIGIENVSAGLGSSAFVAYLSLLCNAKFTGTQFALFTSFMAFGRTWLSASSGWVAEQTDWVVFFVISTGVAVPGLLLLLWMMKHLPMEVQQGKNHS